VEEITSEWNRREKYTLGILSKLKSNHMIAVMQMIVIARIGEWVSCIDDY
jgi:hypothetical protein